jgi:hypothetical protein
MGFTSPQTPLHCGEGLKCLPDHSELRLLGFRLLVCTFHGRDLSRPYTGFVGTQFIASAGKESTIIQMVEVISPIIGQAFQPAAGWLKLGKRVIKPIEMASTRGCSQPTPANQL